MPAFLATGCTGASANRNHPIYNLRHRNEAILDIARAMQLALADLPEFPPRHRIGIKQRGPDPAADGDGPLAWSWARWSLVPPGAKEPPAYPLNNARLGQARLVAVEVRPAAAVPVPASGFWEPEKPAREKGVAPWSYYSMKDGRPFFMAGLWAEAHDPATGEVADTYTVIITDANATMRVHDRMRGDAALGASPMPRRTAGSSRMQGCGAGGRVRGETRQWKTAPPQRELF